MADALVQIALPTETLQQLQQLADAQHRSIDEVVRDLLLRELPGLPPLPADVEAELAAFDSLSDDVLWLLAASAMSADQQRQLAALNDAAQQRPLTDDEAQRQQELIDMYDRVLVRRAQAASILKQRGYELDKLTSN